MLQNTSAQQNQRQDRTNCKKSRKILYMGAAECHLCYTKNQCNQNSKNQVTWFTNHPTDKLESPRLRTCSVRALLFTNHLKEKQESPRVRTCAVRVLLFINHLEEKHESPQLRTCTVRAPETLPGNKKLPPHNSSLVMQRAKNAVHFSNHSYIVLQHKPSTRSKYPVNFRCYFNDITPKTKT